MFIRFLFSILRINKRGRSYSIRLPTLMGYRKTVCIACIATLHFFRQGNWGYICKHCQRHNGPEGWVHITSSNTNLDQMSSSECRPSIKFKISPKHQPLYKTKASKSWPNLASESRPRFNFITSTKHQRQNINQTPPSKSWPNLVLKVWPNFSFQICTKLLSTCL